MIAFTFRLNSYFKLLLLVLVLCRAPAARIVSVVSTWGQQVAQHVWKAAVPAVTVGSLDAQSGATGEIVLELAPGFSDTTGVVGEFMDVRIFAGDLQPQDYSIVGDLPPGIALTDISLFGVATLSGTPEEAGRFVVGIYGWEEANGDGASSTELRLVFQIENRAPIIARQPTEQVIDWGQDLILSVEVEEIEGIAYQWLKDGEVLAEFTASSLTIPRATSADSGLYQVVVTNEFGETRSDEVMGLVTTNVVQLWRENHFENPFDLSAESDADPDSDEKPNRLEFVLGEDPFSGATEGYPKVFFENSDGTDYLVCEFKENPFDAGIVSVFEKKSDLTLPDWETVELGESSILVEDEVEGYRVWLPIDGSAFYRLRLPGS